MPTILKEEEDEAFKNEAGEIDTEDIINKQHNAAVRTIAIGHIVEKVIFIFTVSLPNNYIITLIHNPLLPRGHCVAVGQYLDVNNDCGIFIFVLFSIPHSRRQGAMLSTSTLHIMSTDRKFKSRGALTLGYFCLSGMGVFIGGKKHD